MINKFLEIEKKNLPNIKRILALSSIGQKCTVSQLKPFTLPIFPIEHLVLKLQFSYLFFFDEINFRMQIFFDTISLIWFFYAIFQLGLQSHCSEIFLSSPLSSSYMNPGNFHLVLRSRIKTSKNHQICSSVLLYLIFHNFSLRKKKFNFDKRLTLHANMIYL